MNLVYQITARLFVAGFTVNPDTFHVTKVAPILKKYPIKGYGIDVVIPWCRSRGWKVQRVGA